MAKRKRSISNQWEFCGVEVKLWRDERTRRAYHLVIVPDALAQTVEFSGGDKQFLQECQNRGAVAHIEALALVCRRAQSQKWAREKQ